MLIHMTPTAHGWCLLWDWSLISVLVIADAFIAFAYFTIPFVLLRFVRQFHVHDPVMKYGLWSFLAFITLCGLTHVMDILTIFFPWYWANAYVRIAAAGASLLAAIYLAPALTLYVSHSYQHKFGRRATDIAGSDRRAPEHHES